MLAEAVETLFDGGFGGGESFGDVADGEVVEAEVEECAVVGFEERADGSSRAERRSLGRRWCRTSNPRVIRSGAA